ncbi:DNA adenine methylase [Methylocella silvestris]|uniref:site-specific DNA-methyltransferase (adenine-specific) n=1 Tax=Methylocella silvestris TaxID=199596 RepID=A0A2J7TFT8_METSI|nr:DNA adenine methylase [Methylocella silvestris]PNG25637.1 DNA methyltransferase [Methylocella silvestris]
MDFSDFRRVEPTRPAAAYIGGKKQLAAALVARIESAPHKTYAEPFVGMGGVFLRRRFAPPAEVINDLSGDVATFFRILQRHYAPFMDMLKFQLTSRREFERLVATDVRTLTDLERAARFLYLQRTAFGGKVAGRNFGVSPGTPGRFDVTKLAEILTALSERLGGVVIENLPYGDFITRYDRPETLFYLDPPYFGTEDFYGADAFTKADFRRLADQLAAIAGGFILSINDAPEARHLRSLQEAIGITHTASEGDARKASELVVSRIRTRRRRPSIFFD